MAITLGVAFIATAVICCCVVKDSLAQMTKSSCSHCPSKASKTDSKAHECCFSKASPVEKAQNPFVLHFWPILMVVLTTFWTPVYRQRLVLKSIYLHGPPGAFSAVPIYIKSRSIRI
jgi:hypothetical protein